MQKNMGAIGTGWFWLTFLSITMPIAVVLIALDCLGMFFAAAGERIAEDCRSLHAGIRKYGERFFKAMPRLDKCDRI